MKRLLDIVIAAAALVLLAPLLAAIAAAILLRDGRPVIFRQERVGQYGRLFRIWKFRTMVNGAQRQGGSLTVGVDSRITPTGRWLRAHRLDELPQLVNVLRGEMSLVGPRPETSDNVAAYTPDQRTVLELKPGVTDVASIAYRNESELLAAAADPQAAYRQEIAPAKIRLSLDYARGANVLTDLRVMLQTAGVLWSPQIKATGSAGGPPSRAPKSPPAEPVAFTFRALLDPWQPTFIGIGAAKCATTWCWEALRHHPQVDAGQLKEIDFFRLHFDRGVEWYAKHFRRPEAPVRGEITPLYMDDSRVAERIASTYPQATLLVVLRNPYERALSNVLHDLRDLDGGVAGAAEARVRELAASDDKFLRRSLYAEQLRPFVERFDRRQFAVLFYEDLQRDPRAFLRQLYAAVGADPAFTPPQWSAAVNRTQDYRWPAAFKLLQLASRGANALPPTRSAMQWLYRRTRLREWTLARLSVHRGRPTFDFERIFGAAAVHAIARDVAALRTLLGIELPASWSAPLNQLAPAA